MTTSSGVLPAGRVLAEVDALLDRVDPDRGSLDAAERLALVRTARRVRGRVDALAAVVTAEADGARASEAAAGTPMASWARRRLRRPLLTLRFGSGVIISLSLKIRT